MSRKDDRIQINLGTVDLHYDTEDGEINTTLHGVSHVLFGETNTLNIKSHTDPSEIEYTCYSKDISIGFHSDRRKTPQWLELTLYADDTDNFIIQTYSDANDLFNIKNKIRRCDKCGTNKEN